MMLEWVLVSVVALSASAGDALQTAGMKHHGEIHDFRPGALRRVFARVVRNWRIIASFVLMSVSFLAFVKLLSISDLSFAVPATAAEYVVTTLIAKFFLGESVGWRRWASVCLVASGVALLAK